MKKILSFVTITVLFVIVCSFSAMADIPSVWAAAEVEVAIECGFVPESLQEDYRENISREEFAELAVNYTCYRLGYSLDEMKAIVAAENRQFSGFNDTTNEYVLIAAEMGIVTGFEDGSFHPRDYITREQAAAMLRRTHSNYVVSYSLDHSVDFEDRVSISGWALIDVQFCLANGVMNGMSSTEFSPKGYYTREQAIATFVRLSEVAWKEYNFNARFVRRMTREEVVDEYLAIEWEVQVARFDVPYGTVLCMHTVAVPHSPSFSLVLVDNNGHRFVLSDVIPGVDEFGTKPRIDNLKLSTDKTKLTFDVSFAERKVSPSNSETVIHEAGTYYFEADLTSGACVQTRFVAA